MTDFSDLIERYDHFLFDQFGVLHDGKSAYPQIRQIVGDLKAAGKTVSVITNSGKSAKANHSRIESFGYTRGLLDNVYTSGEIARYTITRWVTEQQHKKPNVFYIGNDGDRSALEGLPLLETDDKSCAHVLVIAGSSGGRQSRAHFSKLLSGLANQKIPAFCTNPDWHALLGNGEIGMGPAQVARIYEELGGHCVYIGKPHSEIYDYIFNDCGITATRTLCVGDSVAHDVAGGKNAGCDVVLVRTGIHAALDDEALVQLCSDEGVTPDYLLETLTS